MIDDSSRNKRIVASVIFILIVFSAAIFYLQSLQPNEAVNAQIINFSDLNTLDSHEDFVSSPEQIQEFMIKIPKIDLLRPVTPDVDPSDEATYLNVISKTVAQGRYTLYPDSAAAQNSGLTYLFAHREGEAPFFSRLDELENGDRIEIDFNYKRYIYKVTAKRVVNPNETFYYTSVASSPTLRLQTCENGLSQRLLVDATLVEVI